MKRLNITPISDSAQFKVKKGTLQFLQDASKEALAAIVYALMGGYDNQRIYIIYGCVKTGSGPGYQFSAGAVFFQGEIYKVDAESSVVETGGNIAIFVPVTTQYTTDADPVTFSDSSIQNIHDIRKFKIVAGTSATSGFIDYFDEARPLILKQIGVEKPNQILYAGVKVIGTVSGSASYIDISFSDVGTADYYVMGTIISNSTPHASITWVVTARTATSLQVYLTQASGAVVNDINFEYILFAK
jgi:hypothetical protein